jgi:hypothetical protein
MIIFTLELTGDSEGLDLTDLSSANAFGQVKIMKEFV